MSRFIIILSFVFIQTGCKKLVAVNPPITNTTGESVYKLDATAIAVLTGLYTQFSKNGVMFTGGNSISLLSGLSADEFNLSNVISNTENLYYYYTNALFSNLNGNPGTENWESFYRYIYTCNTVIEELTEATTLTPTVRQQLLGEAKFIRAFLYFYLVNLYGPVPLAITSDYEVNSHLRRAATSDVYTQITSDLISAKDLLADHYLGADVTSSSSARIRPTKWAAIALLARVYLYTGDFANAEMQATVLINNSSVFTLAPLNGVFLANSNEAIWQLQPVNTGWNTEDARVFIINAAPSTSKPISLNQGLYNSFETGDARRINWIKDTSISSLVLHYPYKYKKAKQNDPVTEYLMVLRLGEQYLIRAEARAQQNNISGAQSDLNTIRNRASLANTTANDKVSLLSVILQERRVELFSEWGHRWLDLKRTGNIDAVMTVACAQKGGTWQTYKQLYPILYKDIEKDQNLTQNPGYH